MHIHAGMNLNSAGIYGAAAGRAEAAQRAAEVRRKLARSAERIESDADANEDLLVGKWMDEHHGRVLRDDEYHGGGDAEFS